MEKLENFIRKNRKEFDDKRVDSKLMWSRIEAELPKGSAKHRSIFNARFLSVAAGFLLICALGSIFYLNAKNNQMRNTLAEQNELQDISSYYSQLITYKMHKLEASAALTDEDQQEFLNYFLELERACKLLESELTLNVDNEEVLLAIVDNYRQRLHVLENLLSRINRSKAQKDGKSILL